MSRAIDLDTAASIHANTSKQVYQDLVQALCYNTSNEVEILGKSHELPAGCNLLVDENNIGISKAKLVQAFVVARGKFFQTYQDIRDADYQKLRSATAVMLLMDPENITAANTRKRIIVAVRKKPLIELEHLLREEMHWVDSMLTSRLHRHTKSPTLWDHRRWVVLFCQSIQMSQDIHKHLNDVVLVAAERHPRNYYAWLHLRWLLRNHDNHSVTLTTNPLDESNFFSSVLNWSLRHPSDTSGFSFLLFWITRRSNSESRVELGSLVCQEALRLSLSFQWTHESVWVFLRTLVASGQVTEEQKIIFLGSIEEMLASEPIDGKYKPILVARNWFKQYEEKP